LPRKLNIQIIKGIIILPIQPGHTAPCTWRPYCCRAESHRQSTGTTRRRHQSR